MPFSTLWVPIETFSRDTITTLASTVEIMPHFGFQQDANALWWVLVFMLDHVS